MRIVLVALVLSWCGSAWAEGCCTNGYESFGVSEVECTGWGEGWTWSATPCEGEPEPDPDALGLFEDWRVLLLLGVYLNLGVNLMNACVPWHRGKGAK